MESNQTCLSLLPSITEDEREDNRNVWLSLHDVDQKVVLELGYERDAISHFQRTAYKKYNEMNVHRDLLLFPWVWAAEHS